MCQTLTLPRRRRVAPKIAASPAAERVLRDIAFVLRVSGRLADEIRRGRSEEKHSAAACALAS